MAPLAHSAFGVLAQTGGMRKGDYVRIEKINSTPNGLPACPMSWYSPGHYQGILSLPQSYWMEGYLLEAPQVRHRILLDRRVRCGVVAQGVFTSSRITKIKDDLITTYNSVYQVRRVPPFTPRS